MNYFNKKTEENKKKLEKEWSERKMTLLRRIETKIENAQNSRRSQKSFLTIFENI